MDNLWITRFPSATCVDDPESFQAGKHFHQSVVEKFSFGRRYPMYQETLEYLLPLHMTESFSLQRLVMQG